MMLHFWGLLQVSLLFLASVPMELLMKMCCLLLLTAGTSKPLKLELVASLYFFPSCSRAELQLVHGRGERGKMGGGRGRRREGEREGSVTT